MHSRFSRRLAASVALVASLASLALPAPAMPRIGAQGDMCVGGKLVPAAPAPVVHDCEACCAATSFAPPAGHASPAIVPFAPLRATVDDAPPATDARAPFALARAPPRP